MNAKSFRVNTSKAEKLKQGTYISFAPTQPTHLYQSEFPLLPSLSSLTSPALTHVQPKTQSDIPPLLSSQQSAPISVASAIAKMLEDMGVQYAFGVSGGARAQLGQIPQHSPTIEWARIAPDKVVVATADRAWLHRLGSAESDDPFARPMVGAGSIATTRKLLDGAIACAAITVSSKVRPPALTRIRWVWRLAGAYHSSRHTSRLMEEARDRFAASGRQSLAQWAAHKAREEAGHDRLALLDIQSMGYDAEAVVKALVPPAVKPWLDYFIQSVQATDPIGCVGFSYASERLGTIQGEEYIQSVEALLPSGTRATRWLRIHSSVGAEVKHVEEIVKVVAELTPQERIRVARACYETALLRFTPPKEGYISDEELQNILKPLELNTCLAV